MDRRILVGAMAVLAGCSFGLDNAPQPTDQPSFVISDGAHSAGNPEFFFLPPLVPNPRRNANWTRGAFNPSLQPSVTICALDLPPTATESQVLATTPCRTGGYAVTFPFGTAGDVVKLHAPRNGDADDDQEDDDDENERDRRNRPAGHYHAKWKVPTSSDVYFRIKVLVGAKLIGFADVHSVTNNRDLRNVNTGQFVPRKDGQTAQIKFRIENRALCNNPGGTDPCVSETVNLATGGTVLLTTDPLQAPSGVVIPPQTGQTQTVVATAQPCADLNPRATDLPTFGSCIRITVEPALTQPLVIPATVFVCDYPPDVSSLSAEQSGLVTLHRLTTASVLEALPHAEAVCNTPVIAFSTRIRGIVRYLAQGNYRGAGDQMVGLIGPTPLQALDRGGGGLVRGFSDFQFALPAKIEIQAGNGQVGFAGPLPVNPTVRVTDLSGDPVQNARVTFAGTGTVGTSPVLTDAAGLAQVTWAVVGGPNTLTASGRGIAGADNNGPRAGIDPFMPIQDPFDPPPAGDPVAVTLLTGSQVFTASAVAPAALPINNLSSNYFFKQVAAGADPGFFTGGVGAGFAIGTAAFGSAGSGCPLNAGTNIGTSWAPNTDILVRRQFVVPAGASLIQISIAIDNDIKVYLDGVDITTTATAAPAGFLDGYLVHENCPTNDSFIFNVAVTPGLHELGLRGRDRGLLTYLDAKVVVQVPEAE